MNPETLSRVTRLKGEREGGSARQREHCEWRHRAMKTVSLKRNIFCWSIRYRARGWGDRRPEEK